MTQVNNKTGFTRHLKRNEKVAEEFAKSQQKIQKLNEERKEMNDIENEHESAALSIENKDLLLYCLKEDLKIVENLEKKLSKKKKFFFF